MRTPVLDCECEVVHLMRIFMMERVARVQVNDLMTQRGWHLSALQHPPAVHMCFTAQHLNIVPNLLEVRLHLTDTNYGHALEWSDTTHFSELCIFRTHVRV